MKIKVRIAVAIDKNGAWYATGFGVAPSEAEHYDRIAMGMACSTVTEPAKYWVEAELDSAMVPTLQGEVSHA